MHHICLEVSDLSDGSVLAVDLDVNQLSTVPVPTSLTRYYMNYL